MDIFVSSTVESVNKQDSIAKNVIADGWKAELAIIARRGIFGSAY